LGNQGIAKIKPEPRFALDFFMDCGDSQQKTSKVNMVAVLTGLDMALGIAICKKI
jgi:hypothetical protein